MKRRVTYSLKQLMKLTPLKVTAAACVMLLVGALAFMLSHYYLDGLLKGRITKAFAEAYPAYSMRIARLHYSVLTNRLECDSVAVLKSDSTIISGMDRLSVSGIGRIQLLWGGGIAPANLLRSVVKG